MRRCEGLDLGGIGVVGGVGRWVSLLHSGLRGCLVVRPAKWKVDSLYTLIYPRNIKASNCHWVCRRLSMLR